jgi:uncharacterized protein YqgV (UPF0045/DUF77 family)
MPGQQETGDAPTGVQFSVYPLRQAHVSPALESAVEAASSAGLDVRVGRLSSHAVGEEDTVFRAIRAAFDAAAAVGPSVMVVTLTSGVPDESRVAEIQRRARG